MARLASLRAGTFAMGPDLAGSPVRRARSLSSVVGVFASAECLLTYCVALLTSLAYWMIVLEAPASWLELFLPALIISVALAATSVLRGHFEAIETKTFAAVAWSGLTASLRAFALLVAILFLLRSSENLSRGAVLCQFVAVTAQIMLGRALFYTWVRRQLAAGTLVTRRVMVLGDSERIDDIAVEGGLCDRLRREGGDVVKVLAWTQRNANPVDRGLLDETVLQCRLNGVDNVVIMPTPNTMGEVDRIITALSETPVVVHVLPIPQAKEATLGATSVAGIPSIVFSSTPISRLNKIAKRSFDMGVAGLMLFLLSPLFLLVALAIRAETRGPVFFRQTRHGYGSRPFRVFKFRSMSVTEDGAAFRQATKGDARITVVGSFLRRSNLDELPQLLNVLFGHMSLVGPRPHPVALNESFSSRITLFHRRHNILPGITGWAQVNGYRGETDTHDKMVGRVEHDIWYIDNWSLGLDLRIMILTVFSSVAYRNAG